MFLETYWALGATSNNNCVNQTKNTYDLYKYLFMLKYIIYKIKKLIKLKIGNTVKISISAAVLQPVRIKVLRGKKVY